MLTKALALVLSGAAVVAGAQTAAQGPKTGAAQKPAAKPAATPRAAAPRTPAQEARDEWNRGAVAYRAGRFADAQKHFERVRQLDPKFKDVRLYIARAIAQQYQPGVEEAANVAKGEEAVAAFEALLKDEPANDDALRSLINLLTQMRNPDRLREAVLRRAGDDAIPVGKRLDLLHFLTGSELKCSQEVTERNKAAGAADPSGRPAVSYRMPADGGDFYRAQQCATNGLSYAEQALNLAPDNTQALTLRAGLLREMSKLSEMEGNTGQKDYYDAQHAELAERLRGLGVNVAPAPAAAPPADAAVAQAADASPVGVAECDQYLAAYESCVVEKIPEAQRQHFQNQLNQTRATWRRSAATPQSREGLANACRAAREQARQTMGAYGCTF